MSLTSVAVGSTVVLIIVLVVVAVIAAIDSKILELSREMNKAASTLKDKRSIILDCNNNRLIPNIRIRYIVLICNDTLRNIILFSQINYTLIAETLCKYTLNGCKLYAVTDKSINYVTILPETSLTVRPSESIVVKKRIIPGLIYSVSGKVSPIPDSLWRNNNFTMDVTLNFSAIRRLLQEYPYLAISTSDSTYYKIIQIEKTWNNIYVYVNSSLLKGLGNKVIIPWTTDLRIIIESNENSIKSSKIFIGDGDEQFSFIINNTTTTLLVNFYTISTQGIYIGLSQIAKANITILASSPIVVSNNSLNDLSSLVKITYHTPQSIQMPIILPLLNKYRIVKQPIVNIDYPLMSKAQQAFIQSYNISIISILSNTLSIKFSENFKVYTLDCNGSTTTISLTLPRYAEVITPGTIYINGIMMFSGTLPLRLIDFKKLNTISAIMRISMNASENLAYLASWPPLTISISWNPIYAELTIVDNYGTEYSINILEEGRLPHEISIVRGPIVINMTILNIRMLTLNRTGVTAYAIVYNLSIALIKPVPLVGVIKIENTNPSITVSNYTVTIIKRSLRRIQIYYVGLHKLSITSEPGYALGFTITIQCIDNRLLTK